MKNSNSATRTAGIIIIGNEILTGKVQDANSFYLATELRSLGVDVRRISVIPDEIEIIGREAVKFSNSYDYVFTTGGVGPTHDDVTMAGIAKGFGVGLVVQSELKKVLFDRFGNSPNDAVLKMSEVPDGAETISHRDTRFPVVVFKNIFIFPGIPDHFRNKFSLIKDRFRSPLFYLKRLFLNAAESDIAGILNRAVSKNTDVIFGSYPVSGEHEYRVIVTAESKSEKSLKKALNDLITGIPENILVKIE